MNRPTLLRALLALAFLWTGLASAQVERIQYDDTAAVLARIDDVMTTLEDMRAALDRTAFDAGELAFELAFEDADTIAAWVEERIAFEPYAGVLRGPDGTLRARAGNAFDQALLLARLLNDAGFETRIAVANLADEDAARLLERAATSATVPTELGDVDAIRASLARLSELLSDEEGRTLASFEEMLDPRPLSDASTLQEIETLAADILGTLDAEGVRLAEGAREQLLREVASYAWTEYRLGPNEPWTAAHPTGFGPPDDLEVVETFGDTVPEAYLHRIRVEAWIESKAGGELTIQPVMAPWERPVANADHVVIDYANAPDPAPVGDTVGAFDLSAVASGAQAFIPNLFGELAESGLIFDLDGRVLSPDVAGNVAAGVFRSVAANAESALGALSTIGSDEEADDALALTAHGLDITVIAPDGTETTYRRWIVDRLGAEARAAGDTTVGTDPEERIRVARALVGRHRIMVSTGAIQGGFLLDRAIERALETRPLLELVATSLAGDAAELRIDRDAFPGPTGLDQLGALDAFDRALADADAGRGYRPSPAVLIFSENVTDDGDGLFHSIDIVANPRRVLAGTSEGLALDVSAAVRRGAWETIVERQMLASPDASLGEGDVVESVAAADLRGPYRLLQPGDAVDAGALGIDSDAAARLSDDLARGAYALLGTLPDSGEPAWWRVDPVSGTTLGITADGRGQSATEYTIQLLDNAATLIFAIKGLADCNDAPAGPPRACCLLKAHLSNVAGFGLGNIVSAGVGTAAAGLVLGVSTGLAGVDWSDSMGLSCEAFGAGF